MQRVSTCLWFDSQAEQAVAFYLSVFPNSIEPRRSAPSTR